MQAKNFIFLFNDKAMQNVNATGLQSYFLQFEHTPFTTIFILLSSKLTGNSIEGMGISFKQ